MIFRQATQEDIPAMQVVRNAVKENVLSDPSVVSNASYIPYLETRGMGWICTVKNQMVGFAILDNQEKNVWALFVHPNYEAKGIGYTIHKLMLDWYFSHKQETLWLSTDAETRADKFYRRAGWEEVMRFGKNEIKFELSYEQWIAKYHTD